MADQFLYEASMMTDAPSSPFLKKQVVYVNDTQNTSNYTGQINLDLSQLSNSYQWIDFTSMVWEIPFTINIELTPTATLTDIDTAINSYFAGLKNGTHQIIQSLSVSINNTSVVQLSNYLNHYIQYKMLTSLSDSDVKKWGASMAFAPDSATSFRYSGAGTADGAGFTNNRPNSNVAVDYSSKAFKTTFNSGFSERLRNVEDLSTSVTDAWYNQTMGGGVLATTKTACQQNGISYFETKSATQAAVYILATIRFKDMADLFSELPLLRGTYVTAVLNYNASVQTISIVKNTGVMTSSTPLITGLSNPLLVSSAAANQPNAGFAAAMGAGETAALYVSCNVGTARSSNGTADVSNPLLGGRTRVSADLYSMNPIFEQRYLSLKTKDVYYTDIYTFLYQNQIGAGQPFNFLATNGISQPTAVIVVPYCSKSSNTGLTTVPIYQSPFASEPGTTSTIPITNLNIQVSGQNIFQDNFQYDYQQFLTELASINALNGGASTGITSGLISQQDFQYGYRYAVADLSRRLPNDDISRSISVLGTNNSGVAIDILVIIEYRRKLTFDLDTGAIVPTMK
jgi:hypothetical protein